MPRLFSSARAAARYAAQTPGAARYRVTLYGSLAATGRGHMTDPAAACCLFGGAAAPCETAAGGLAARVQRP